MIGFHLIIVRVKVKVSVLTTHVKNKIFNKNTTFYDKNNASENISLLANCLRINY